MSKDKNITISSQQHIRIKKLSTLSLLQQAYDNKKGDNINAIINKALDLGLPALVEDRKPDTINSELEKYTNRIVSAQTKQTQKIMLQLNKLSILLSINESIVSTIVQELEFFMRANGVIIPDELLEDFKNELPTRFETDKEILIRKLSNIKSTD
ncbi:MAG: hypothetical protein IKB95_04195 [Bacteroidales bacterium]|nr:hypothetical protein [Bacteroidales bacterium]